MGNIWDEWDDYVPAEEANRKKYTNPNLLLLTKDNIDNMVIDKYIEVDELWDDSEEDYEGNEFIRFVKEQDLPHGVTMFQMVENEDIVLFTHGDQKVLTYIYDRREGYLIVLFTHGDQKVLTYIYDRREGYLIEDNYTITGWDDNLIVNLKTLEYTKIHTR